MHLYNSTYCNASASFSASLGKSDNPAFFSSNSYRFGFNGQEKDNEVSGEGNSYTAEFWQYDSRLGRRFNLDPKGHPAISYYACFNNNPIAMIDPDGDTSIFYGPDGTELARLNDDLENAVVVVDNMTAFLWNSKAPNSTQKEINDKATTLRKTGKSYVVDEYRKFFNDNYNLSFDRETTPADGKGPLANETGSFMSNQNGYIRLTGTAKRGDPVSVGLGSASDPDNSTRIHTHPNEGRRVRYANNVTSVLNTGEAGLDDDIGNAKRNTQQGFLRVVVAKDAIYLYNGNGIQITFTGFK